MLSSMPGSAITSVKIDGVMHEFQKIDGIIEDVTTIVLNLKSVVIKNHTKENKTIRLSANNRSLLNSFTSIKVYSNQFSAYSSTFSSISFINSFFHFLLPVYSTIGITIGIL